MSRPRARRPRNAASIRVQHTLPADTSEAALLKLIADLNADPSIDGILVQLPLPGHIDSGKVIQTIAPEKDVDGFHFVNVGKLGTGELETAFVPCTPAGSMLLIERVRGKDLSGLNAVVVGRSNIVGKPMANLLLAANCTVTIAHSRTKDLPALARTADILVAAVGRPEMVKGDWVKPGATVIDVGINRVPAPEKGEGKYRLVGDVAFAEAAKIAGAITPVPGGVGPMTIALLMANTLVSAYLEAGLQAAVLLESRPDRTAAAPMPTPPLPVDMPVMSDQIQGGRQFAFLLVDKFSMFSLAAAIDTFRSANRLLGRDFYGWTTVSADGDAVMASNGLPLKIDYGVADIPPVDILFVSVGLTTEFPGKSKVLGALRSWGRRGGALGALSVGSYLLAEAGQLEGYRCTIHWENRAGFMERFPEINCTGNVFEIDRKRYTCAGGTTSIDLMLEIVRGDFGSNLANGVANQFQHERIRSAGDRQRVGPERDLTGKSEKLRKIVELMADNLDEPFSAVQLAKSAGLSVRQVERLFLRHLTRDARPLLHAAQARAGARIAAPDQHADPRRGDRHRLHLAFLFRAELPAAVRPPAERGAPHDVLRGRSQRSVSPGLAPCQLSGASSSVSAAD